MTSCKNRQFLPPFVMVRHYCLDPLRTKNDVILPNPPPFELFAILLRIYRVAHKSETPHRKNFCGEDRHFSFHTR